ELLRVCSVGQALDELEGVLVQHLLLVVLVLHEVVELLAQIVEEDGVGVDVLEEVLARSLAVTLELDATVRIVQIEHGVECVIVEIGLLADDRLDVLAYADARHSWSNPLLTLSTSSGNPRSSNW